MFPSWASAPIGLSTHGTSDRECNVVVFSDIRASVAEIDLALFLLQWMTAPLSRSMVDWGPSTVGLNSGPLVFVTIKLLLLSEGPRKQ